MSEGESEARWRVEGGGVSGRERVGRGRHGFNGRDAGIIMYSLIIVAVLLVYFRGWAKREKRSGVVAEAPDGISSKS